MSELNEQIIELTIEALTGTIYDLCVSPFETILGIKMKIQRLEGIPVYQQQLVHGNTELHDEFCLEEYSIGSGAQLKLLVAMRGGPIHAHRVQLEDPTLLEIAEVLEAQDSDHKYTVMLLTEEDALEMAEFVDVVAEESPGHVSPLPQATATEDTASSTALSKATRTKMQDLMTRLRSTRKLPSLETGDNDPHLHRRGTSTKLFILDSRSPSQILHSSAPSPVTPHQVATPTSSSTQSAVHRKLVYSQNTGTCTESRGEQGCHVSHHKTTEQRVCPGASEHSVSSSGHHSGHHPLRLTDRHQRGWRRRQRLRRPSCLADKSLKHCHTDVGELALEMTQLGLRETGEKRGQRKRGVTERPLLPKLSSSSSSHSHQPNLSECSNNFSTVTPHELHPQAALGYLDFL
ncbi:AN1-type zinc finger protein 4, partial [Geodia barretti]